MVDILILAELTTQAVDITCQAAPNLELEPVVAVTAGRVATIKTVNGAVVVALLDTLATVVAVDTALDHTPMV